MVVDNYLNIRVKRGLDIAASSALLVLTLPLMCLTAMAIRCESHGPIFEKCACLGKNGHRFYVLSFRTTRLDATQSPWARPETKLGHFLRVTRIEVLPQLVNVLRGEMSLFDSDARFPTFLE
jgi:lipopolysaccharide/colanic/teichoic acid biosynthesis glycosyltransferase